MTLANYWKVLRFLETVTLVVDYISRVKNVWRRKTWENIQCRLVSKFDLEPRSALACVQSSAQVLIQNKFRSTMHLLRQHLLV